MNFTTFVTNIKNYFTRQKTYNPETKHTIEKWMGHKKVYDLTGNILSDSYENGREKIKISYYPGTDPRHARKRVMKTVHYSKKSTDFYEKWYLLGGEEYAVVHGKTDSPTLSQTPVYLYLQGDYMYSYGILQNLRKQMFQEMQKGGFAVDLKKIASDYSEELDRISISYPARKKYEKPVQYFSEPSVKDEYPSELSIENEHPSEPSIENEPSKTVQELPKISEVKPVMEEKPQVKPQVNTSENIVPQKPEIFFVAAEVEKTPEELKQDRWETQLLQRMEKHDVLLAQKAKVEGSVRMKPERKAERLASLERRIRQNEKAQAILNRKLTILATTKNRDEWKKIKQEERQDYVDMSAEHKQERTKIAGLPENASAEEKSRERLELKQVKQLKKESYDGYRFATKVVRMNNITLRKLRDTKRQNTIFELSYIVREKMALEKALKIEKDMFNLFKIQERLNELSRQKIALIRGYQATRKPSKTAKVGLVQPMLPGMSDQLSK